jgi:pyrroloquinoline-quinone synthase
MDAGELSREELQRWVANRFYYQRCIPLKDAAILSNCPDVDVRREWISRIIDHDGTGPGTGGIESWLRLGEALGVTREELESEARVLPAVRYAVDAYVNFARQRPWIEAVASSLTELFGPSAIKVRLAALEEHYPWIDPAGLQYFRDRLVLAPRDADYALRLVVERCLCKTPAGRYQTARDVHAALDAIRRSGTAVVVEGNFDVLALHAAGVEEALFVWIAHDVAPRAMSPRIKGYVQPQSWFVDLRRPYLQ